jgi:hypothetical protein
MRFEREVSPCSHIIRFENARGTNKGGSMHEHHPPDPAVVGQWEPVQYRFQHLPIHSALLHTGKVLGFGGSGNDRLYLHNPHPAELFDPATGAITPVNQPLEGDLFCAGHTQLADGRLLVAGGTSGYDEKFLGFIPLPPFRGLNQTYIFDPVSEQWQRVENMGYGRWYPTLVMLADGRIFNIAGLTEHFPWAFLRAAEVYSAGGWQHWHHADAWMPLYPRLHLFPPDGNLFYAGSYNTHYTFPFLLNFFPTSILNVATGKWKHIGLPRQSQREEGTSVLLPLLPSENYRPRVLLIGGGTSSGTSTTNQVEMIDLWAEKPTWQPVESMKHGRYYNYAMLLPDRNIMVLGGRSGTKQPHDHPSAVAGEVQHDPLAILEPEMFHIDHGHWHSLAPMTVDRLYHSNALLLPDGRVFVAGSNPIPSVNELRIEIYHPPYLFKGARPEITSVPAQAAYGASFEIESPAASEIDEVALIRLSVTTHCLNTDQRYVGLAIHSRAGNKLTVQVPQNPSVAPPGYYMLFILRAGVPSVAKFIRLA